MLVGKGISCFFVVEIVIFKLGKGKFIFYEFWYVSFR